MNLPTLKWLHQVKDVLVSKIFFPIAKTLNQINILPNHITIISVIIGLLGISFMFISPNLFVLLFVTHLLLDLFDGYYAREFNLMTDLGEKLDHGGDFLTILLAFFVLYINTYNPLVVLLALIYLIEVVIIVRNNLNEVKFPSRLFIFFCFFGLYELGIIFQMIYEPISLMFVLITKRD